MKKEYDFSKAKKADPKKVYPEATTTMISFRADNTDISLIRDEADRLGIPYQTLVKSVLHRFAIGELIDKKEVKRLA